MNLERISAIAGLLVLLLAGGVAWGSLTTRVDSLAAKIDRVEQDGADELCQQLMLRQVTAIEKGKRAILEDLSKIAVEHGCLRGLGDTIVTAASEDSFASYQVGESSEDQELAAFKRRREFVDKLSKIDKSLFPERGEIDLSQ